MSEYSAEELLRLSQFVKDMQSILGGSRDDNDDDEARAWDDYEKASSALAAYAKRIKAAQVDTAAKPHTLADFINAPDAERAQVRQRVVARVDEMMAEPVAQAWLCDNGASENLMVTLSPRSRDAYAALGRTITPLYTHPAPPIDLAAVREVIAEIRRCAGNNNAKFHLTWADKLTAALQEKGNG